MVQSGWDIVCEYYQNVATKTWVPWSKSVVQPNVAAGTTAVGTYGALDFELLFKVRGGSRA